MKSAGEIDFGRASDRSDKPILTERGTSVSYARLDACAKILAAHLFDKGVNRGDKIAVLVPMSIDLYVCLLAVMGIGATAVFVQTVSGISGISEQLDDAGPKSVITTSVIRRVLSLNRRFRSLSRIVCIDTLNFDEIPPELELPVEGIAGDSPAFISYTTGSTGKAKQIIKSYDFLRMQSEVISEHLNVKPDLTELVTLPGFVMNSIVADAHTILPDTRGRLFRRWHCPGVARQITEHGISRCTASPGFLSELATWADKKGKSFGGIEEIYTGGAPIGIEWMRSIKGAFPNALVYLLYGSTEVEPISSTTGSFIEEGILESAKSGSGYCVGKPANGVTVKIDTSANFLTNLSATPQESGEILVSGDHVNCPKGSYLRTSDVGYLDSTGNLWLTGRSSLLFERHGATVEPYRTEAAVATILGITRAALLPVKTGSRVVAALAISIDKTKKLSRRKLREEIVSLCSRNNFPVDVVVFVRRMPVDKRHLYKIQYGKLSTSLSFRVKVCLAKHQLTSPLPTTFEEMQ